MSLRPKLYNRFAREYRSLECWLGDEVDRLEEIEHYGLKARKSLRFYWVAFVILCTQHFFLWHWSKYYVIEYMVVGYFEHYKIGGAK